jgi:hypothetical protein
VRISGARAGLSGMDVPVAVTGPQTLANGRLHRGAARSDAGVSGEFARFVSTAKSTLAPAWSRVPSAGRALRIRDNPLAAMARAAQRISC